MTNNTTSPRIRLNEALRILGCSKTHLYDLHHRRLLLRRTDGKRFTYWIRAEVEAFALGLNPYENANEASAS